MTPDDPRSRPFPALTAAEMAQVDRIMVETLGLDVLQLMELAGHAVAAFARDRFLGGDPRDRRVVVLAGSGGNGGDGLVAARLLHGWGATIEVILSHAATSLRGAAAHQARILTALDLEPSSPQADARAGADPSVSPQDWRAGALGARAEGTRADLLIDALLGFGLSGPPTGVAADLIRGANAHPAPVLAVDLPSGLDATTGAPFDPCVRADATLTLALPKTGLLAPTAQPFVGELHVADIGVPAAAYARLGLTVGPLFAEREIVRLAWTTDADVR